MATGWYTVHYCYVVPYCACVYDSCTLYTIAMLYPAVHVCMIPGSCSTANSILRLAVDGRIVMFFRPPGFSREKGTSCIICNCFHTYRTTSLHTHMFYTRSQLGVPLRGSRYDPGSTDGSAWSTWRGGEDGGRGRYTSGFREGGTTHACMSVLCLVTPSFSCTQ